jgi:hypothetical protein
VGEGRYRALIDNVQAQNRKLWGLVVVLVVLLAFAVYGLHRARQALPPAHIPPELRFGAMLAWGEVPPPNVYMFAGYIFQQLNLWMKDDHKDYGQNIFRLQAFLTPKYRAELEADTAVRLRNRTYKPVILDPRTALRGEWLAATFQYARLLPAGHEADTTAVYLISARPFADALGVVPGRR